MSVERLTFGEEPRDSDDGAALGAAPGLHASSIGGSNRYRKIDTSADTISFEHY